MKKLLIISTILSIVVGITLVTGGVLGIAFTYMNIARENITTPEDASIPGIPVRGPFTLKAQADIIRTHTLRTTEGKTFAEMPRQIQKVDENGVAILDETGKPVMVVNSARDIWITATTLITALNLGIIAYAFFSLVLIFGLGSLWAGVVFYALNRKYSPPIDH